jgi:hypothetical protein
MKKILFLLTTMAFLGGCPKTATAPTGTMSPIQTAGCDVETAILGTAASAVASALSCTGSAAIQASLTVALGNANLCASPIVSGTTMAALKSEASAKAKPMGVVGNLACPIAINTIVGFLSNSVPTTWGCSATSSASALVSVLTAACESAVPI